MYRGTSVYLNRIIDRTSADAGYRFPRLRYDGKRHIAIVVAAPTPLHGDMVGELLGHLGRAVDRVMVRSGIEESIVSGVSQATNITEDIGTAHGRTVREWDGAFRYLHHDDLKNMIAIEVAVSQSYKVFKKPSHGGYALYIFVWALRWV
ncbi:hypothetical protein V1520DRAFT_328749 [Lipomyces starkeyi]